MNRRDLIRGAALAGAVASLDTLPTYAAPVSGIAHHPRITLAADTWRNPHAAIATRWCDDLIKAGVLYARNADFGYEVKMTDPRFHIVAGKPIWNWMTGYTDETGVAIFVTERGIPIGTTSIATSIGYETYWTHIGHERDMERHPDYFVRALWLSYDDLKLIEPHLPKGHVDLDMRMFEHSRKQLVET